MNSDADVKSPDGSEHIDPNEKGGKKTNDKPDDDILFSDLEDEDFVRQQDGTKDSSHSEAASSGSGSVSTTITLTKDELASIINQAAQRGISEVASKSVLHSPVANTKELRYYVPNFSFPTYAKEDKLMGTKNYIAWKQRLELDLRSNRLLSYVECELGNEDLTVEQRHQLDAAALRHI